MNVTYPFGRLKEHERSLLSPRFDRVIHVIRNPLDQISSFTCHTNRTYEFTYRIMNQTVRDLAVREEFNVVSLSAHLSTFCWSFILNKIGTKEAKALLQRR